MTASTAPVIFSHFEDLTDPRMDRTNLHLLVNMIVITLCAAICGAEGWADVERFGKKKKEWFARFLELPNGIRSYDTFGRVFARLDTSEPYDCPQRWIRSLNHAITDHGIRLDGKTLRHSFDTASGTDGLQLLNAWSSDLHVCPGKVAVAENSNEITAVPKHLELMDLTGVVVTLDAVHCQKETAQAICDKGANYVLTVKGNQPKLHAELQKIFEDAGERDYQVPGLRQLKKTECGRGRIKRRKYYVMPAPTSLRDKGASANLKTVGMAYRERDLRNSNSNQVVLFISSLPASVQRLAKHLRGHWGVENSLHWSVALVSGRHHRWSQGPNPPRQCPGDHQHLATAGPLDSHSRHCREEVLDSRRKPQAG